MRRILPITILAALAACSSHKAETKSDEPAKAAPADAVTGAPADAPAPTKITVTPPVTESTTQATQAGTTAPTATTQVAAPGQPTALPAGATVATTTSVAPEASATQSSKAIVAVPAAPAVKLSKPIEAIVNAKDRTDADRALDAGRKPGEMLTFFELKPGMKVAEIGAGAGYTTELLARAVGATGTVYAQNPPMFVEGFLKTSWPERLARPINAKVIRADRDFASPLPDDAKDLDAIVIVALYHDIVWMGADRKTMNVALFKALKPGGVLYVIDSSARADSGIKDVKTLHRIDEAVVLEELEEAGFRFDKESDFLRNPLDARDWSASPKDAGEKRGTSDRFALKFLKPKAHHKKEKGEKTEAAPAKPADAAK